MNDVEMDDTTQTDEFYLSRVIEAHNTDVKCITSTSAGVIISGGRDDVVKFWNKRGGEFSEALSFPQPKGLFVNSIGYYDSSDGWLVFAGRKDGSIAVYGSGSSEPLTVLTHHSSNVCCLYVDEKNHILLSGSWDNDVVVWPIKHLLSPEFSALLLTGHTYSVWALAAIECSPGFYLTGSADKTIKLWHDDNLIRTYTVFYYCVGHNDVVRALLVVSADLFLSAGNDASIRMWHIQSDVCLSSFPSSIETILCERFIGIIGKSYVMLPNRRYSRLYFIHQDRFFFCNLFIANETVRINVSLDDGVPTMQLLYKKGTDPALANVGEFIHSHFEDYNLPASYLDEITEYIKGHVPEAVAAAVQPTQRVMVDGKEYDYALDVTVGDGRKLRLPYNLDEDPEVAVQRFIEKHNLPIPFLSMVCKPYFTLYVFISLFSDQSPEFFDPLTGNNRYVPKKTSGSSSSVAIADPFTGTSRYIPGNSFGNVSVQGCGDPYTSSGDHKSDSVTSSIIPNACLPLDKKRPRGELVPVRCYYRFGIEQLSPKALAKLVEVNEKQHVLKLSDSYVYVTVSALDVGLQWTMTDLVPILDVFRVALLHEYLNAYFCDMKIRGESTHHRLSALLMSEPPDAVGILVCRSMTNAFTHPCGRDMLCHDFQNLFAAVTNQLMSNKVALQLAATSTLANWSLLLLNRSEKVSELGPREDAIRGIVKKCETISSFGYLSRDSIIRLLQAIVTFMWGDTSVIRLAKSRNLLNIVNKIKDAITDEQGKSIARDIMEMIYSV
uniref:Phospholipase A-2-activating protein n=1 Tax=Angiostrongylus cantonensis TaxID=6313 RepID=A0A0K0DG45_ANGCA